MSNRLGQEKSPYLLQHKDNPIHWYAWGDEAFEAARAQNKLIFLSIGYSTCHWCHVMAHDSFEKQEVAQILNDHFISIKVDREERPDVDGVFMDVVVSLTGHGGWPLSAFLTPELKPFYGGTFFWKHQFIQLLQHIQNAWKTNPEQILQASQEIVGHLREKSSPQKALPSTEILAKALRAYKGIFDTQEGGFGGAPKFPKSTDLSFLMTQWKKDADPENLHMITLTLDKMAAGGIYDHLGGGFHRYATDERWLVPHFEKMLYDNALLIMAYVEAAKTLKKPLYGEVARDVCHYILRDMTRPQGGFYSAEDADSEGEEGKFYVWKDEEIESDFFKDIFDVTPHGNFEHGTNILHLKTPYDWEIKKDPRLIEERKKLFETRKKRVPPLKDEKILVEWNGLMIAAMAMAHGFFKERQFLEAAVNAARFIRENLFTERILKRRAIDGEMKFEACLNDYACLIWGLCSLYETTFDSEWIDWALELQKIQDDVFWDKEEGGYFFSKSSELFTTRKEFNDGAIPSGNSISAYNLIKLHQYTGREEFKTRAQELLAIMGPAMGRYPHAFSQALVALDAFYFTPQNFCVGPHCKP